MRWILGCFLFLSTVFLQAQNGKKEVVEIKTNIYCDHCKQCDSCGKNIYDALHDVKGVTKVAVLDGEGKIRVSYNGQKTSVDAIRKAITGAGYDADDAKAEPVAYQKLDDCCKKK